mmetsp:Transcript_31873/g.101564  ORF Transcript_31873/g.101564 Transcript_31873/m.101564 type:complete len:208 (+) Transcript_31873:947-1570(+)
MGRPFLRGGPQAARVRRPLRAAREHCAQLCAVRAAHPAEARPQDGAPLPRPRHRRRRRRGWLLELPRPVRLRHPPQDRWPRPLLLLLCGGGERALPLRLPALRPRRLPADPRHRRHLRVRRVRFPVRQPRRGDPRQRREGGAGHGDRARRLRLEGHAARVAAGHRGRPGVRVVAAPAAAPGGQGVRRARRLARRALRDCAPVWLVHE